MLGHTRRVTDLAHSGAAGVLSTTRRGRVGLQQELGEAREESAVET